MYSNPEPYTGDQPLYCHLGIHEYTNGKCQWCNRPQRNTIEYKPAAE